MGNEYKITAGGPDIKAGLYPGKFKGAEIFNPLDAAGNPTSQWGPSRKWHFDVLDEEDLVRVDRLTSMSLSPGSEGGKILTAIMGRQLEVGETGDLDDLIDRPVQVLVAPNKKDWMHAEKVLPAKTAK